MKHLLIPVLLFSVGCASNPSAPDVRPYPLDTCVVMDSKLGSMGDPIVRVYDGQEIKFCCKPCIKEFEADPEFYLGKIDLE